MKYKTYSKVLEKSNISHTDSFFPVITTQDEYYQEILERQKGKPMLGNEGYIYILERTTEVHVAFQCKTRDCRSILKNNVLHRLFRLIPRCHTDYQCLQSFLV
jgi:hypothetical protein